MLTGKTNEEKIWNYLTSHSVDLLQPDGGIDGNTIACTDPDEGKKLCRHKEKSGNLYAESGLVPANLQNTYEKKLGYTDATYTAAVDSGAYANFAKDGAGYGLAQWTYHTRKAALLAFAKAAGKSVGDLETQLAFLVHELRESYKLVHEVGRNQPACEIHLPTDYLLPSGIPETLPAPPASWRHSLLFWYMNCARVTSSCIMCW